MHLHHLHHLHHFLHDVMAILLSHSVCLSVCFTNWNIIFVTRESFYRHFTAKCALVLRYRADWHLTLDTDWHSDSLDKVREKVPVGPKAITRSDPWSCLEYSMLLPCCHVMSQICHVWDVEYFYIYDLVVQSVPLIRLSLVVHGEQTRACILSRLYL